VSTSIGELFLKLRVEGADQLKGVLGEAKTHMLAFGAAATAAGVMAVKAASDFNESSNVIQQAFGRGAASAERWAAATGQALGRSTQSMRETVSVMQAMLVPMTGSQDAADGMSKALTKLAVDMGSFWNVADKDAFEALRSAMSGESEPMKRFGVVMNEAALNAYALGEGINVTMQSMTEAEKTQVRYHFLMEQTAMVQGDAARTADSFANQMKAFGADVDDAAVSLGQNLLPEAQEWLRIARETMAVFKDSSGSEFLQNISIGLRVFVDTILMAVQGWLLLAKVIVENNPFGDGKAPTVNNAAETVTRMRKVMQGGSGAAHDFSWDSSGGRMDARADSGPAWDTGWDDDRRKGWASGIVGKPKAEKEKGFEIGRAWNEAEDVIKFMKDFGLKARNELNKDIVPFHGAATAAAAGLVSLNGASEKTAKEMTERERKLTADALRAQAKRHAAAEAGMMTAARSVMSFRVGGDVESMFRGVVGGMEKAAPGFGLPPSIAPVFGMITDAIVTGAKEFASIVTGAAKALASFIVPFLPSDSRFNNTLSKGAAVGGGIGMAAASATAASPAGFAAGMVTMGPMSLAAGWLIPVVAGAAAVGGALMELSKETQSYKQFQKAMSAGVDEVVNALEPFWQNLMPVAGTFMQVSKSVGLLGAALMPGGSAAEWFSTQILEAAQAMTSVILGVFQVSLAFADARLSILEFAEKMAPGSQFADSLAAASRSHADAEEKVRRAAALDEQLGKMSLSELAALANAVGDTTTGFRALNATMTNMPSGFKGYAAAALAAMDATGDPMAGGGDGMSATGRRNRDMEGRGREAGFEGERGVHVAGNVIVVANDPQAFRVQLERQAFVRSGTPLQGVSAYMNRS